MRQVPVSFMRYSICTIRHQNTPRARYASAYVHTQHASAYVSRRAYSAYVSIRQQTCILSSRQLTSAYVSIRQHTCSSVPGWHKVEVLNECFRDIERWFVACGCGMRQHTSAYISIRQHSSVSGTQNAVSLLAAAACGKPFRCQYLYCCTNARALLYQ
jgi:hypothetical protein